MTTELDFDPFQGGELAAVVPLTGPQREVWLASLFGTDVNLAFNESVLLRLRGPLQTDALEAALQTLVQRHEALRSTVSPDGQLLVAATGTWPVTLHTPASEATLTAICKQAVTTPFDLERGPLARADLVVIGPEDHALVVTAHHIICDGWSTGVLLRELGSLYAAISSHRASTLPPATSWASHALAEAAKDDEPDVAWWLERLREAGPPPPLDLPTDRARPAIRTYRSERLDVAIPERVAAAIDATSTRLGGTPFAGLLAGFAALLGRIAPRDDGPTTIVIGVPSAGQALEGRAGRGLVGHAVNLLPITVAVDASQSFAQLLGTTRESLYGAFDHAGVTFGRLLEQLALPRDPSRPPLVAIQFNLDQGLDPATLGFPGLEVELHTNPRAYENFELFVNAQRVAGAGLRVECQFNADLFDGATIAARLGELDVLLASAAAEPELPVGRLPLLRPEARQHLLELGTGEPVLAHGTLPISIVEKATALGSRIALVDSAGSLTWTELADGVLGTARSLVGLGVRSGDIVGLAVGRSTRMVVAALAIQRAGAAYLPIDVDYPPDRVAYMIEHSRATLVLCDDTTRAKVPVGARVLALDALPLPNPATLLPVPAPQDIAYVIYTSGSTGKPKGVEVPHGAVSAFLSGVAARIGLSAETRLVAVTTLSFDIAVLELFAPLLVGGTVVVASRESAGDGKALSAVLERHGATAMQATPATWRLLLESGWQGGPGFLALVGGEAFPGDLREPLLSRSRAVWNLYGPTETTVWSTAWRVEPGDGPIPIGVPLPGERALVVDSAGELCPIGVPGELLLGGAGVTRGYRFDEAQTNTRFHAGPFGVGRVYRTGDRARWIRTTSAPGAALVFERRVDTQVKVRGFRIELGEIESALSSLAGVQQAVAAVYEPRPGDTRLVAYVVPRGAPPSATAVREHVQAKLPPYMVPQHVVILDAFPLTPNGKVDRNALPRPEASAAREHVPPRTETERRLSGIIAEVLGIRRISMTDDFFDLGGHSILATRVVARIQAEMHLDLPLRRLFETPGLEDLSRHLDGLAALNRASQPTPGANSGTASADYEEMEF